MSDTLWTCDTLRRRLQTVERRLHELRAAPPLHQFHCATLLRRLVGEADALRAELEGRRRLLEQPVVPLAAWQRGPGGAPALPPKAAARP
jgi:hypothetical protein